MSFWDLSEGGTAKASEAGYEVPSGNMEPIPMGSFVLAMIDQIKWDWNQARTAEFISARWTVLGPKGYENRKVFHKLWVTDFDPSAKDSTAAAKKRDKARIMLANIDLFAGARLSEIAAKPSDQDLQKLANKPMVVLVNVWSMPDTRNGGMMHGNWIGGVYPKGGKELHIADAKPLPTSPQGGVAVGGATGGGGLDDEIPF